MFAVDSRLALAPDFAALNPGYGPLLQNQIRD
jgi:hypothetical protein